AGAEQNEALLGMAGAVNRFVPPNVRLEQTRLAALISRTQRNMHAVVNLAGNALGHGLYPQASFFNHACRPNSVVSFLDSSLVVRTIAPIKAGEEVTIAYVEHAQTVFWPLEVTIAYVELYAPRDVRRQQLQADPQL
ncbi:hypothetical protein T484DRAFT_1777823, partial [Baffinella frigidus]